MTNNSQRVIQRATGLIGAESPGETILVNLANGRFYGLGQTGAVVWDCLEKPTTRDLLTAQLIHDFEVLPQVAATDLDTFLAALAAEGLIVESTDAVVEPILTNKKGSRLYAPPRLDCGSLRHAAFGSDVGDDGFGPSSAVS